MRGDQEIVVVVRREGAFLVMRRAPERLGYWSLVAGGLEPEETPREAAQRELLEETGLTAGGPRPADRDSRTLCSTTRLRSVRATRRGSRPSPSTRSSRTPRRAGSRRSTPNTTSIAGATSTRPWLRWPTRRRVRLCAPARLRREGRGRHLAADPDPGRDCASCPRAARCVARPPRDRPRAAVVRRAGTCVQHHPGRALVPARPGAPRPIARRPPLHDLSWTGRHARADGAHGARPRRPARSGSIPALASPVRPRRAHARAPGRRCDRRGVRVHARRDDRPRGCGTGPRPRRTQRRR